MVVLKLISWLLVALALMLLGADFITWLEVGTPEIRTTAEIMALFKISFGVMEGGPVAPVVNFLRDAPMWAILGVPGIILTLLLRPID